MACHTAEWQSRTWTQICWTPWSVIEQLFHNIPFFQTWPQKEFHKALQHLPPSALFRVLFSGENGLLCQVSSSNSFWFFGETFLTMETNHSAEPFMNPNLETIEVIIT